MINHILVPLDGSHLGESGLPLAARIASSMNASITLVHVIEKNPPAEVHGERHLSAVGEAQQYLAEVAARRIFSGITVEVHVHESEVSDVARSLAEHCAELSPDLIVITTHGKRDPRQIIMGTLAQQVIGLGRTPVLVVRQKERGRSGRKEQAAAMSAILVPLDGDDAHEKGLPIATQLARAFHSRVHLLMVVPKVGDLRGSDSTAALLSPNAMRVRLDRDFEGGEEYLNSRAEAFAEEPFDITTECVRGDPPNRIVKAGGRLRADLIVLGTHGKAGSRAFWNESVAARVVARTDIPVLLVPLGEPS